MSQCIPPVKPLYGNKTRKKNGRESPASISERKINTIMKAWESINSTIKVDKQWRSRK
jgi:hypothetical protein